MKPWIAIFCTFHIGLLLACCEKSRKNTSLTEADTTQILQLLLTDPNLDKQLNGFREKQLKIVQSYY